MSRWASRVLGVRSIRSKAKLMPSSLPTATTLASSSCDATTPVIDQRLDLGERRALGPVVHRLRVRPAGLVDAAVEVLEVRLRDGEGEGGDGVIHGFLLRFGTVEPFPGRARRTGRGAKPHATFFSRMLS